MSEATVTEVPVAQVTVADVPATPGARLRAEREQRGMSAQKAADELHLDAWVIDALEAGEYERIGPAVYAKGHLRNYAAMLELPVSEIMAALDPTRRSPLSGSSADVPVGTRRGAPWVPVVSRGQAAAAIAAVALLAGVIWWQPWHRQAGVDSVRPGRPLPTSVVGPMPENTTAGGASPDNASDAAPAEGMPAVNAFRSARTVEKSAAESRTPPGRVRLKLSFTSDSWVEVRDASGSRTFAGNGSANTVKRIAGNAPLHVYLGSANGVQLEINGRAVAIGPRFFSGDAARFEAGADGLLRRDAGAPAQTAVRPSG